MTFIEMDQIGASGRHENISKDITNGGSFEFFISSEIDFVPIYGK